MLIRSATVNDAEEIATIYNRYIESTTITFEEAVVDKEEISRRIEGVFRLSLPYLVAEISEPVEKNSSPGGRKPEKPARVVAYAYATKFRERTAYRFTVETAIYVAQGLEGKGIGLALYSNLVEELRNRKIHRAIAGITLPNPISVHLHEKIGFTKVGVFSEVGFKFNQWLDVGFWELPIS